MVTAELATGLTVVSLVLGVGLQALALGVDEVRCVDAARIGARAAARGDGPAQVRALALARLPMGSEVSVSDGGGEAVVEVAAPSRWALTRLGVPRATSRASVPVETNVAVRAAG